MLGQQITNGAVVQVLADEGVRPVSSPGDYRQPRVCGPEPDVIGTAVNELLCDFGLGDRRRRVAQIVGCPLFRAFCIVHDCVSCDGHFICLLQIKSASSDLIDIAT